MPVLGRLLPVGAARDAPVADVCLDPSSAQLQTWLAQARRDRGMISDREMALVEAVAGPLASRSRTIFNPFTGEIRRIEYD